MIADNSWSTSDCSKTDQVFNPYNKTIDQIYSRDCNKNNVVACRLGDMFRKLSTVDIVPYRLTDTGSVNLKKYYFVDTSLPLCGPNSVIGKSVQINQNKLSPDPLVCTNIVLFESEDQDYPQ